MKIAITTTLCKLRDLFSRQLTGGLPYEPVTRLPQPADG